MEDPPPESEDAERAKARRFIEEVISLFERYRNLSPAALRDAFEMKERRGRIRGRERGPVVMPSPADVARLHEMSREQLINFLNDRDRIPTISHLEGFARALHIKNTSRMSEKNIKRRILLVVYDKPRELHAMMDSPTEDGAGAADPERSREDEY